MKIPVKVYEELKRGEVEVLARKSRSTRSALAFVNIEWFEGVPYKVSIV